MIARIQNRLKADDKGFTLIELLVVMIIIGILAAIAIPIFLSQREKAQDSAAKADVSTLGKEISTVWVDGTTAPAVTQSAAGRYLIDAEDIGGSSTNVVLGTYTPGTATTWCVSVSNPEGDVSATTGYQYSAQGGLAEGFCGGTLTP